IARERQCGPSAAWSCGPVMRERTALSFWPDWKAMSSRCRPAATKAAIFLRCSPAATTPPGWFLPIASATAIRPAAWPGMSTTFCINSKTFEIRLGYSSGETYSQQSVRLNHGDLILAFSDGATEVRSPLGEQLTSKGFLGLAERTLSTLPHPLVLRDFSRALIEGVHLYRGQQGAL